MFNEPLNPSSVHVLDKFKMVYEERRKFFSIDLKQL
jgi:hypothetical protein